MKCYVKFNITCTSTQVINIYPSQTQMIAEPFDSSVRTKKCSMSRVLPRVRYGCVGVLQ